MDLKTIKIEKAHCELLGLFDKYERISKEKVTPDELDALRTLRLEAHNLKEETK